MGVLLFTVGLLLGQQARVSKFEKYLHPVTTSPMDLALLRVNLEIVREKMNMTEVPTVAYYPSCACFKGRAVLPSGFMKQSLDEARGHLLSLAIIARGAVEWEFSEVSKWGTVPDRDFKMTFVELSPEDPSGGHDIAEYADGRIAFK